MDCYLLQIVCSCMYILQWIHGTISSNCLSVKITKNCYKLLILLHLIGWEQIWQWEITDETIHEMLVRSVIVFAFPHQSWCVSKTPTGFDHLSCEFQSIACRLFPHCHTEFDFPCVWFVALYWDSNIASPCVWKALSLSGTADLESYLFAPVLSCDWLWHVFNINVNMWVFRRYTEWEVQPIMQILHGDHSF